jgi:hypothetical protein
MIRAEIKSNVRALGKRIDQAGADLAKAQLDAVKVEGFSLRHTLMQAIRMSAPAPGRRLKDLSMIARTLNRKSGVRQPRPLLQLAAGVTYRVDPADASVAVGFTARSPLWARRAAERQQAGFTRPVTPELRLYFLRRGAQRSFSRSWRGRRSGQPLFLRRTTRTLVTPPRPIVAPFWAAEKNKSMARIRSNFRLIARGKTAPGGALYSAQEMAMW